MRDLNEADFYLYREQQERQLAAQARDPAIAGIHLDMAEHYASLAQSARSIHAGEGHSPVLLRPGANNR
jgi:hypothetical protein